MPITTVQLGASLAGNESSLATSTPSFADGGTSVRREELAVNRTISISCSADSRRSRSTNGMVMTDIRLSSSSRLAGERPVALQPVGAQSVTDFVLDCRDEGLAADI